MAQWEQSEIINQNIPVINIEMPITRDYAIVNVRGDEHIGHKSCDISQMREVLLAEQAKYKNNMLVINTGDMVENILKGSTGSLNELAIPDPDDQVKAALALYEELDADLYGKAYDKLEPVNRIRSKHARRIGVIGNHEYRTRIHSGVWLNEKLYSGKGVIDGGIHCLINIKLVNKRLKLSRTYRLYVTHRLANSTSVSDTTLINHFKERKSLVAADAYICGHYHKDFAFSDTSYDVNGQVKKVLYVTNPSTIDGEYAIIGMFNPVVHGYFKNIKLPLHKNELIESIT